MRALLVLALLAACHSDPAPSMAKTIRDKCGNAPELSGLAMSKDPNAVEMPTGQYDMVLVEPRDYEVMIKWRDCVAALP